MKLEFNHQQKKFSASKSGATGATKVGEDNNKSESHHIDQIEKHSFTRRLIKHIPYPIGSRLFKFLFKLPFVLKVFDKQILLLQRLNQEVNGRPLRKSELGCYIQANYTSFWRLHALMTASDSTFEKYVTINNRHYLDQFYRKRGVVLCNSHYGAGKSIPVILARAGFDLFSLDRLDVYTHRDHVDGIGKITSIELGKKGDNFSLKQTFKCKKALESKALLHIAADGFRGTSVFERTFLGKNRPFRKSFAELAVVTGSVVLPVFGRLHEDGRIELDILEPIDPLQLHGDKNQLINQLCDKYVALLEKYWCMGLANVHKSDVKIFSSLPPVGKPNTV